jgi:hypothetical protein
MIMTSSETSVGRPTIGPLSQSAFLLLEANAFKALRGPKSRGAVPIQTLAANKGVARATVTRGIERELGHSGTPFDLAVSYMSADNDSGGAWTVDRILTQAEELFNESTVSGTTDREIVEKVVHTIFADRFEAGRTEPGFLASYIVQCAASGHILHEKEGNGDESTEVANDVLGSRRLHFDHMVQIFEITMTVGLRRIGRRPRGGIKVRDIVVALNACYDGMLLRGYLQPDSMTADVAADVIWQIAMGMTEFGILCPPGSSSPLELKIIENAIVYLDTKQRAATFTLESGTSSDVSIDLVKATFSNLDAFADRCMDFLLGPPAEIRSSLDLMEKYPLLVVDHILRSIYERRREFPALIAAINRQGAFVSEVELTIAQALVKSEHCESDSDRSRELFTIAKYLVALALDKPDDRWREAVSALVGTGK